MVPGWLESEREYPQLFFRRPLFFHNFKAAKIRSTRVIMMNQPQHIFAAHQQQSPAMFFYLHADAEGLDERRIVKARSSWALSSRLNGMKKRHSPPTSKSLPAETHREKRSRSSNKKTSEQERLQLLVGRSRWESSPPSTSESKNASTSTSPLPKRGSGRPTLPKRQTSLEISKESKPTTRMNKLNDAAKHDKTLRSFRRSFQSEPSKARLTKSSPLKYQGTSRCR